MAIIKLGTTVVGIRGTIAGVTYSANKAGPHAKGWTRGANPRTTRQATQRNRQSQWAQTWRTLTAAQRTGWDTYAALPAQQLFNSLGVGYYISGFAWYVSCNTNLALAGSAAVTAAPAGAIPAAPTSNNLTVRITGAPSLTRWKYTADATIALKKGIAIWLVNSVGRSVGPNKRAFMLYNTVDVNNNIIFQTQMESRFGTVVLGQRCFAQTWNISAEGRCSTLVQATVNTENS